MIRGLVRVYGGRIEPGSDSPATFRERGVDQLYLIADTEGVDLRPRVVPLLDLCERFYIEAGRIEHELGLPAASKGFMEIQPRRVCRRPHLLRVRRYDDQQVFT